MIKESSSNQTKSNGPIVWALIGLVGLAVIAISVIVWILGKFLDHRRYTRLKKQIEGLQQELNAGSKEESTVDV